MEKVIESAVTKKKFSEKLKTLATTGTRKTKITSAHHCVLLCFASIALGPTLYTHTEPLTDHPCLLEQIIKV